MFSCCFLGRLRIHWCHRRTYEKLDPTAKKGQIIMGRRKRKDRPQRTTYGCAVSPEFKRHIEKTYDSPIDLSDAPDEMRLSNRILRLIDPYRESMDILLLADCAAIAWNKCIDEDFGVSGSYSLNNVLQDFSSHRELIDQLQLRKRLLFKNDRRHVKEVRVYPHGDGISLNVASELDARDALAGVIARMKNI